MSSFEDTPTDTKLENTSPQLLPADAPSTRDVHRSWSSDMADQYPKRPTLQDLLSSSPRLPTRRHEKAHQASLRAAIPRTSTNKSFGELLRQSTDSPIGGHPPKSFPVTIAPSPSNSPHASGPPAGLQRQPGTSEHLSEIRRRFTHEQHTLPVYLIRTDLRYAPSLDTVTVYMELPGLRMQDVTIKIGNRSNGAKQLIVNAISRPPLNPRDEMAMQERCFGIFTRTLVVPPHIQGGDIKAEMVNGLLVLLIPGTKFESVTIHSRD